MCQLLKSCFNTVWFCKDLGSWAYSWHPLFSLCSTFIAVILVFFLVLWLFFFLFTTSLRTRLHTSWPGDALIILKRREADIKGTMSGRGFAPLYCCLANTAHSLRSGLCQRSVMKIIDCPFKIFGSFPTSDSGHLIRFAIGLLVWIVYFSLFNSGLHGSESD